MQTREFLFLCVIRKINKTKFKFNSIERKKCDNKKVYKI